MVLMVLAFVIGGLFGAALLAGLLLVGIGLTFAGRPSMLTYWLLGGSALAGICAAAYVWWVLGAQIDSADTLTPPPAAAAHGGAGLVVLGLSIIVFVLSAVSGRHDDRTEPARAGLH